MERRFRASVPKAFTALLICVVAALLLVFYGAGAADAASEKTVRVGWYQSDQFQEGTSDGEPKSGYSYEYLQKVADYNGWNYEYVYGGWTDLFQKFENGEIDVMAGVSYTEERKDKMLFPDEAMGHESYVLYQHANKRTLDAENLSTFAGKKLGAIKDNLMTAYLEKWVSENNVPAQIVYFDAFEDRDAAFESGQIDAVVTTDNNVLASSGYATIATVGESPYYLAVAKGRTDLLSELNQSISRINDVDPFFLSNLKYYNYGTTLANTTLTSAEQEWVNSHGKLTVGYLNGYLPFSTTASNGEAYGLVTDVVGAIVTNLELEGKLKVVYRGYDTGAQLRDALKSGEIDAAFPVGGTTWDIESDGAKATSSVISSAMCLAYVGDYSDAKANRIALTKGRISAERYLAGQFPNCEIVYYDTLDECLQAVMSGKVDSALINSLRTNMITQNSAYKSFSLRMLPKTDERRFAVLGSNSALLLLLDRGLGLIGANYANVVAYNYVSELYQPTTFDYISARPWMVVIPMLVVIAVIACFIIRDRRSSKLHLSEQTEKNLQLQSAMETQAEHMRQIEELNHGLEEAAAEQEAHIEEVTALNDELEERQAQLEEATAEQEAHIEEVTALNAAIEENNEELSRNLAVIEASSQKYFCMYWIDVSNRTFKEIKALPNMTAALGASGNAEAALGMMTEHLVVPEDRAAMRAFSNMDTWPKLLSEDYMISCEYRGVSSGWSRATIFCAGRDEAGECNRVVYASEMIHDEIAIRNELEAARKAAESANEAKSNFLFSMSHDIRTPMNAVIGFTRLFRKNQDDPERRADYLDKIEDSSGVMLSIINNVLEMARIESGAVSVDLQPMNVLDFKDGVVAVFADMMRLKGLEFTVETNVEHLHVCGDETKAAQILNNIISNAYKYTEPGGKVSVVVDELPCDREGFIVLRIVISDTGIGMDADYLPKLFEEFTRERTSTETKVEGTGLGMPIVKRLVELVDGSIEVESEKGVGTTFTLQFPCALTEFGAENPAGLDTAEAVSLEGSRILLAEDNDLNAEISIEILNEFGILADRAEDGAVCVQKLQDAPAGYYDAILMDIQMPNMNGYEATHAIRGLDGSAKAGIPIIAMTANAFDEDKRAAIEAGMNGHVAKPINVDELVRTLAGALRKQL